ncbi:hypothetical protein CRU99_05230 [Malaciobacter mytili]|uniref:DUF262 domain-containing protein n=1 Tax=Malaciobacter mytili TaxID=603050 RepID=UPI00100BB050|nr:DUF262 domain-containing protein [Malaciobacter mytili]RXI44355.1 hypothetical protein CRU99_05230 [Malaciobacter mytili]
MNSKLDETGNLWTLTEVFENNYFSIPDYQRGYAWTKKEVSALLEDVEGLYNTTHIHFTGTIVIAKNVNQFNSYDIVDGQQRMTTLVILIAQLLKNITNNELKNKYSQLFIRRGEYGNERDVFVLNQETKNFFDSWIIENEEDLFEVKLKSHLNIKNAKIEINDWLKSQYENNISYEYIFEVILNNLGFLVYSPNNDSEIGIMFEVINNRGKPLSDLEKIKNYFIYYSTKINRVKLQKEVNTKWAKLLENLNDSGKITEEDEKNFLRYCTVVYFRFSKTKSHSAYESLKKLFPINKLDLSKENIDKKFEQIKNFLEFLLKSSKWYAALYSKNSLNRPANISKELEYLRSQNTHASIMPLYFALMARNNSNSDIVKRHLKLIEILNFRVYIARKITSRSDAGQGPLFDMASKYYYDYNTSEWKHEMISGEITSNIDEWLEDSLMQFINKYSPINKFKDSFLIDEDDYFDFYRWGGIRYFLMNYEEYKLSKKTIDIEKILQKVSEGQSGDYYSLEHIFATKYRIDKDEHEPKYNKWLKRRLGNFILLELSINIQASDKKLSEKIQIYTGKNSDQMQSELFQPNRVKRLYIENKLIEDDLDLYKKIIETIENEYIQFAVNRWSLDNFIKGK